MNRNFDEPANALGEAAARRRASRTLGIGLVGVALACVGGMSAWADWTPPESSVTPPAVVTLDAFAARDANGGAPSSALVAGPDGALYGSTPTGGAIGYLAPDGHTRGYGTLFRVETNGTFTGLHDFNGTDGSEPRSALTLGPDGALYGSTSSGGTSNAGTLFRLKTDGTFTKLHDFNGFDGYQPLAALVVGADGALYGSTQEGGSYFHSSSAPYGWGTLFRVETNGAFTKLHDFNAIDGREPLALVVGPDGALYGSTMNGGTGNVGTLFRLQANGGFTKLNDFNLTNGAYPWSALVVGPDGALYGSTYSGGNGDGTLFRLETNGTFTTMYSFNYYDGQEPTTALVVGSDGALYGSARYGGINGVGTLFRLEINGAFTKLHDFTYTNDVFLSGNWVVGLIAGPDGALYGSTQYGGINGIGPSALSGYGTLFRLRTDGTFTKLHDFNGTDGSGPLEMTLGPDGALYGPTSSGTLFGLQTNGAFSNLYNFASTEGNNPLVPLVVGPDGAMHGSTGSGGTNNYGTLFRVEANGTFSKLHDFNYTDGSVGNNSAALLVGPDGALYGSTYDGGTNGYGTLFRLHTDGRFQGLHDFSYTSGAHPLAPLVVGSDGALYGSTVSGGATGNGTLLRLGTNGAFTKLYDFNYGEGILRTALVLAPDGALYGSTYNGGTNGYGTLFQVKTDGTFTKLYDFNGTNGAYPLAALVVGPDGALYGSTYQGGSYFRGSTFSAYGTLFRVQTNGTFTKLHDFNVTDGAVPTAAMVVGPDGALYGTTQYGGTGQPPQGVLYGYGTLFQVKTNGTFTKLHDFNFANGVRPVAALVVGPEGALYGTTQYGGTGQPPQGGPYDGYGTLFQVKINGAFTKLYDFNGTNGARPMAALVVGPGGSLYGTTPYGGPRRGGILFKVVLNRSPVSRCHNVTVTAGANCAADASVDDGSFDPDAGDTITLNQEPPGPYPVGVTPVTLTVTDNHGASTSCTATVTVMDVTPPAISDVAATPNVLWPPNHKMVEVTVNYAATDNCGAVSNALSVTNNEALNGTAPDWVIEDSHRVQLRAERSNTGVGRVYAITVVSTDNAGNSSTRTVTVTAPKNQN